MLTKILDFMKYPSTWSGLVGLLSVVGVTIAPEQTAAIVTAGVAVASAIAVFFSDTDVK